MAIRFYLMPKTGDGLSSATHFRPKYITPGIEGTWMGYGAEPTMLVAVDVTPAQNTAISANADVITVPANIDNTIGANLAAVQAALDSVNIPSDWITSGMTYRTVLRWLSSIMFFMQRFNGQAKLRFFNGVNLSNTVGDLSANVRQKVTDTADSFGISTAGVTLTTTLRDALKILVAQIPPVDAMQGVDL